MSGGRGRGRGKGNHGGSHTNGPTAPTTAPATATTTSGGPGTSPAPSLNGHAHGAAPTNNHVNGSNSNGANGNGNGNNHHNHNHNHNNGAAGGRRSPQTGGGRGWRVPPSGLGLSPPPNGAVGGPSSPNLGPSAGAQAPTSGLPAGGFTPAQMAQIAAAAAYNQNVGMPLPMPLSMGYPGMSWPPSASPYFPQNPHAAAAAAAAAQFMPSPFYNPYGAMGYNPAAAAQAVQVAQFQMLMAAAAAGVSPYQMTAPHHLPLPLPVNTPMPPPPQPVAPTPVVPSATSAAVLPPVPVSPVVVPVASPSVPQNVSAAPAKGGSSTSSVPPSSAAPTPTTTTNAASTSTSSSSSSNVSGVASLTAAVAGLSVSEKPAVVPTGGMMGPVLNGASVSSINVSPGVVITKVPVQPGPPPYYALDVECIATGPRHDQRAVGQIALLDQFERVQLNLYVRPTEKVASYLPALTGLSEEVCNTRGIPLDLAIQYVKAHLPANAILVGQGILKDVQWLGLEEGKDFGGLMDLAGLWRTFNPKFKNYSYFSLHHKSKCILGIEQQEPHSPVIDAQLSIRLFNVYKTLEQTPDQLQRAHEIMLTTPVSESFAAKNPVYEGVCMGYKRNCRCGAPFFYG